MAILITILAASVAANVWALLRMLRDRRRPSGDAEEQKREMARQNAFEALMGYSQDTVYNPEDK